MRRSILLLAVIMQIFASCNKKQGNDNSTGIKPKKRQPNVIVILTDDQGYKDVGFNGSPDIKTPNIDRIAENGVVFTNGYVSYAVCGPSRAGLITGRYQDRFGFSRNPLFAPKDALQGVPKSEEMLSEALKKAGYKNMAIGKWHLGAHASLRPLERGFDEFFGFLTGGHKYFPEQWTRKNLSEITSQFDAYNTKLLRNNKRIEETEYLTDALSREAVNFVERNKNNPFFLYLAYNAPHTPLQATQKYLERYAHVKDKKRQIYAAMVSAVDDGVGNLLNKLEELKINENSIVFFLSDNGGPENHSANNAELREGKGSMYEGGIRVPFAVQWPGTIPKGKQYHNPVISLDIFATAVVQANVTPKHKLDGVNLIPYLTGENSKIPHDALYWRQYDYNGLAVRKGDFKLVKDKKGNTELYNLLEDISEEKLLKDSEKFSELKQMHDQWNTKNPEPAFLGLRQNKAYNKIHPDRFTNGEEY
ncbi:sulfatase-like hydrolase/transferase [Tamlana sp. 2201CG12-4]|uniref:sulfatase-like hydrolase/transferase n=1 Tax=Tamlana sp. 2201CG12-4 TaxID=3112582 RepID=UPI002DB71AA4|nr:sulfatase-like hydrolase/transferase [Tamlana sp. 2201CG12-4]MEC3907030.1 sulfatase-like hydrolase/transferase [Tamlana sp. 2201CG12-4]